jgi:UDP-N-acetylmuramate--alanine ligase
LNIQVMKLNIDKITRVHFIGIGGIGMSALARHLLHEKKQVSGSDAELSPLTKALDSEGVQIFAEQLPSNISKDIELVVYTEAVAQDHPELAAAKALKIPTLNYFEALGLAMNPYYLIAVAGTHGKTTTTAMMTDIFELAGSDPTSIIGSLRASTQSNYRAGKSKYAIVEACEYKRDFLHLKPDVLVITNLEHDHVDYYKDIEDVQAAFRELAEQVDEKGVVIANTSDANVAPVLKDLAVPVKSYISELDLELALKQPGLHNRLNAAAAATAAKFVKIDSAVTKEALANFAGTWRRFEYKGELNGAPVYDDYGHHPTEIRATIEAVRELYRDRKLTVVFQPHTFTRTKTLFVEFAKALGLADSVILLPIYAAREENLSGVTSRELSVKALEYTPDAQYCKTFDDAEKILKKKLTAEDVVVVMGAGDVTLLAGRLVK